MGSPKVEFHPLAAEDARDAFEWYWIRNSSAASAFERELDRAVSSISQSPERYAKYLSGTRRFIMFRFPYVIVYRVQDDDHIVIIAVAHGSRRPGFWKDRLN